MSASIPDTELRGRLDSLEHELEETMAALARNDARLQVLERRAAARPGTAPSRAPVSEVVPPTLPVGDAPPERLAVRDVASAQAAPGSGNRPQSGWQSGDLASLSDFLGGRALAWLGGVATLLGIILLLVLAISHGWIGREVRVALAAAASAALMLGGCWLHARRGRTEAAVAMVGAATAGAFATLVVAGQVYALIPSLLAVIGAMSVGALATGLAIRWAGRALAALGLVGGLLSPLLVGAPHDAVTLLVLAVGAACAIWVVLWRRWAWLALATVLVTVPQWAWWMLDDHTRLAELAVLTAFGTLGLIGAIGGGLRGRRDRPTFAADVLVVTNAVIMGVAGRVVLGPTGGELWLAAMAAAHAGAGLWRRPVLAVDDTLRRLLIAVGVIIADVALGLALHGVAQAAAWGLGAVAFGWLVRRAGGRRADEAWLQAGLGGHVALVVARALIELPPARLGDPPQLAALASTMIVAVVCLGSARLTQGRRASWRTGLDALGLVAVAYLTAATLDGAALVAAWAVEATALAQLAARTEDRVARLGAAAFLGMATVHTALWEIPPTALVDGVPSLGAAAVAVGATAAGALRLGLASGQDSRVRLSLLAGAGLAPLVLASVAITTAFQPAAGAQELTVLDLGVRQQGQVLLSALWGIAGVAGLIAGLRRNVVVLRMGALAVLLVTVAKVFLYDLSTLTSIYRVMSFFVVGGLLLGGAFAYQRLRPPPVPDMRSMHPSQR